MEGGGTVLVGQYSVLETTELLGRRVVDGS